MSIFVPYSDPVFQSHESYLTDRVDPSHPKGGVKRGREVHAGQRVLLAKDLCKLSTSVSMRTAHDTVAKPDLVEWDVYKELALEVDY
ncbi:hypothetical protein LTS18_009176 [Coniosporium uncinatum]|uniref:Uncharacterized protein n=1 Tax=Coniosporium uncinatum TaxID=93489 RepID=A0ACC3D0X0_9PEZI|nr:hypothetical protein LTS18_009176 [Coniosporium uncinatum]